MSRLVFHLETTFGRRLQSARGAVLLVAFSGGTDSAALLWGLHQVAPDLGIGLHAAHLDHALDDTSSLRAECARAMAARLDVPFTSARLHAGRRDGPHESVEAAARRERYRFLECVRHSLDASYIATAHHRDDQTETVLLRMLFGSCLEGLAAIQPVRGRLVRPLLELSRNDLERGLEDAPIRPIEDPTNADLTVPRNRVRHGVVPRLEARSPTLGADTYRLAEAARRANLAIEQRLLGWLAPGPAHGGIAIDRRALERLPDELWPRGLALIHRLAGADYPPTAAARRELRRQLGRPHQVGCDCGGEWRWETRGRHLVLLPRRAKPPVFTYTLQVPGTLEIPELFGPPSVEP